MSRVLVLGNATLDVIQRLPRLPRLGETLLSGPVLRCPGGKGLNQAVAAARTGASVTLVAAIGRDGDAALMVAALDGESGLTVTWQIVEMATDISSIWVSEDGENMILSTAECARSVTPEQARQVCASLEAGDILLMQGNLRPDTTAEAAKRARARGARTVLNTAPITWDMQPVLGLFDVVVANEGEAAILTNGEADVFWPRLRACGVQIAVVTLGANGARICSADGQSIVPTPPSHAVDTAGAGDVMVGTLIGCLVQGRSLADAAGIAVAAASLSVGRHGTLPSFPTRTELRSLMR